MSRFNKVISNYFTVHVNEIIAVTRQWSNCNGLHKGNYHMIGFHLLLFFFIKRGGNQQQQQERKSRSNFVILVTSHTFLITIFKIRWHIHSNKLVLNF